MKCAPQRKGGNGAIGSDWGVETFLSIAHEDGSFSEVANPRFFKQMQAKLEAAQQALARKKKGSKNRTKAKRVVVAIHRKSANQRRDFLHQTSAAVVGSSDLIAGENLSVKNMTRSAKGNLDAPGRNVAQKAALNREILATAPRAFHQMLEYKAEEAGIRYLVAPTRTLKPSQRCSGCWTVRKKTLAERQHVCECGTALGRDRNAARVILLWAIAHTGREPTGCLAQSA